MYGYHASPHLPERVDELYRIGTGTDRAGGTRHVPAELGILCVLAAELKLNLPLSAMPPYPKEKDYFGVLSW